MTNPLDQYGVKVLTADAPDEDWRDVLGDDEEDPDDELLAETPPDVIAALGYDPLDPFEDDDDDPA